VGLASAAESARPERAAAIAELERLGLAVELLTGDAGEARAAEVGIERWHSGLSGEQKRDRVAELQAAGHKVFYVGDGVNDAAALHRADVGVAVGEGTPLAHEAADLVWWGGKLAEIPEAIRQTTAAIRSNLWLSAGYNSLGMGLAAAGLLHPVWAAVLMTGSSMLVAHRAAHAVRARTPNGRRQSLATSQEPALEPLPRVAAR